MAAMGGMIFALYGHEEILKKSSSLNRLSEFGIISQDCSLGDPFQKLFTKFGSVEKHGRHGWMFFSHCGIKRNSSKFSSETACQILNNFTELFFG